MIKDIALIPDSHSRPGILDRRFRALNKYIKKHGIERVVHIGDHWDFPSMCNQDSKRSDFHSRSYEADLNKGFQDLSLVLKDTGATGDYVRGNHDDRPERFLAENARFDGHLVLPEEVLPAGWTWHRKEFRLEGILFRHFEVTGISGKPISGDYPAAAILKKNMCSTIVGHSHVVDFCRRTRGDGKKITAIVSGCFLDPAQRERYAEDTQRLWTSGFWHLRNVREGDFDFQFISTKNLLESYS